MLCHSILNFPSYFMLMVQPAVCVSTLRYPTTVKNLQIIDSYETSTNSRVCARLTTLASNTSEASLHAPIIDTMSTITTVYHKHFLVQQNSWQFVKICTF
uniref:Putative secreted protein n=1 Tax=Amblyomma cajennense TaxID=34607 RepID=A0A023FBX2_AMBCJ